MTQRVFLDTQYLLALVNPADHWHDRAVAASEMGSMRCTTTDAVLTELADALCRATHRAIAAQAIHDLASDKDVRCIPIDRGLFKRGLDLYQRRPDKDWSLTDCLSFVVMADEKLELALTADHHFEQAGFRALLLR